MIVPDLVIDRIKSPNSHRRSHDRHSTKSKYSRSRSRSPNESRRRRRHKSSDDRQVEDYIDAEKLLKKEMDLEKNTLLQDPHLHPDYNEEWESFYVNRTKGGSRDVDKIVMEADWVDYWKKYFYRNHDKKYNKKRAKLMAEFRLDQDDLEDYYHRKSSEMEAKLSEKVSNSKESATNAGTGKRAPRDLDSIEALPANPEAVPFANPSKGSGDTAPTSAETPSATPSTTTASGSNVTVVSTLRLLTALESVLDELGPENSRIFSSS